MSNRPSIAAVLPCYRVRRQVMGVLDAIGPEIQRIYCVDDGCPEHSGDLIESDCRDPRVRVIRHERNRGVGGALITGYRAALADGADIVVKLDADGQMDPRLIASLIAPILLGRADYTKGNRFFSLDAIGRMPTSRLVGNAALSFLTKLSTGYWTIFDPTNGFTAIHQAALRQIPLDKVAQHYFFETDLLFRLNIARAVVEDVPMTAVYGGEQSSLRIARIIGPFWLGHSRNFAKRLFYNYFLRDFHVASLELVVGLMALIFGICLGASTWIENARNGTTTPAGTVMLAGLPVIVGIQLLLSFLNFDMRFEPTESLQAKIPQRVLAAAPEYASED